MESHLHMRYLLEDTRADANCIEEQPFCFTVGASCRRSAGDIQSMRWEPLGFLSRGLRV